MSLANSPWPKGAGDERCTYNTSMRPIPLEILGRKWQYYAGVSLSPSHVILDQDGYIYIAVGNPSTEFLLKLNPVNGAVVWQRDMNTEYGPLPPIACDDGYIYVYASGYFYYWGFVHPRPYLYKVRRTDGNIEFTIEVQSYESLAKGFGLTSDNKLIVTAEHYIHAYDTSGNELWKSCMNAPENTNLGYYWPCSDLAVGPSGRIYFGWQTHWYDWGTGGMVCWNSDGTEQWRYRTGNTDTGSHFNMQPVIDLQENIYGGRDNGTLYSWDSYGNVRWTYSMEAPVNGPAALSPDGSILYVFNNGKLWAFTTGGTHLWTFAHPDGPVGGSFQVLSDGSIITPGCTNRVILISPDGTLREQFATQLTRVDDVLIGNQGIYVAGLQGSYGAVDCYNATFVRTRVSRLGTSAVTEKPIGYQRR